MAGATSTITYDEGYDHAGKHGAIRRVFIDWVSDDSTGAVTATTGKIVGQLLKVITDPGSPAPSPNYDIVITDESGSDVLSGFGGTLASLLNRHTTTTEATHLFALNAAAEAIPGACPFVCDALTVAVTNAGNSKAGRITIYYR